MSSNARAKLIVGTNMRRYMGRRSEDVRGAEPHPDNESTGLSDIADEMEMGTALIGESAITNGTCRKGRRYILHTYRCK